MAYFFEVSRDLHPATTATKSCFDRKRESNFFGELYRLASVGEWAWCAFNQRSTNSLSNPASFNLIP
ncbi:hypothetical protein D9M71_774900 [compost metagenome]